MISALAVEDLELVRTYTEAWVRWALVRLERLLNNSVTTLIADLTGTNFYKGLLAKRLQHIEFETLGDEEQERLGFAVAERGARRGTFVVAEDGLGPLVQNNDWPIAYQYGVAQGLLLTSQGTVEPVRCDVLEAVLPRLGADLLDLLLEQVETAAFAPAVAHGYDVKQRAYSGLARVTPTLPVRIQQRWARFVDRFFEPF
jgi:hypothetical protein